MKRHCRALLWSLLGHLSRGKPAAVLWGPSGAFGGVLQWRNPMPPTTSRTNWPGKHVSPQKADPPAPGETSAGDRNHTM